MSGAHRSACVGRLFLSHVRTGPRTNPQASIAAGANGVCETTQTRDASVVHRLSCTAMGEGGRKFALEFVGDGRRVSFPRKGGGR